MVRFARVGLRVLALVAVALAPEAAAAPQASPSQLDEPSPPRPGLRRVLVLARHGNRAPNPQLRMLCPNLAETVVPKFQVSPAALSRVGMTENWEHGRFLRHRYRDLLPEGSYTYDGTFAFFSERTPRNIVATNSLASGVFPIGTGLEGFERERPNIVPIATTQGGVDVLLNTAGDGPCLPALARDCDVWDAEHEVPFFETHKELFRTVAKACGGSLEPGSFMWGGKKQDLAWALQAVMDGFTFSTNEGLDATMGGRLAESTIQEFHEVVEGMLSVQLFGEPHQITYWSGDFVPTFLSLAHTPLQDPVNKLHVFLTHRELQYAVTHLLGITINFPGIRKDTLPSGSSMVVEVYDDGVRLFMWAPTRPDSALKARYLEENKPLTELYSYGTLIPVGATGCPVGHTCPVDRLALSFVQWVAATGTYVELCNVSHKDKYVSQGDSSLSMIERWVKPRDLQALARQLNMTLSAAEPSKSLGVTEADHAASAPTAKGSQVGFAVFLVMSAMMASAAVLSAWRRQQSLRNAQEAADGAARYVILC